MIPYFNITNNSNPIESPPYITTSHPPYEDTLCTYQGIAHPEYRIIFSLLLLALFLLFVDMFKKEYLDGQK